MAGTALLFMFLVFFFADTGSIRLNVSKSALHWCCLFTSALMSVLVYIGSFHLQIAASQDDTAYSDTLAAWARLYLMVSYLCFHGGLALMVSPSHVQISKRGSDLQKHRGATHSDSLDS